MSITLQDFNGMPLLADLPPQELDWLVANGREEHLEAGQVFNRQGDETVRFYITLQGELQVMRETNGREQILGTIPPGIMGGELPILLGPEAGITSAAILPSRLFVLDEPVFRQVFSACPVLGRRIFRTAMDRFLSFTNTVKQQEKMAALGKLAAGLAHELNNPASAVRRSSKALVEAVPELQARTLELSRLGLSEEQLETLKDFQESVLHAAAEAKPLSTMDQADREEALGAWLEAQEVENPWEVAANFVSAGITLKNLQVLTETLSAQARTCLLGWLNCAFFTAGLVNSINHSSVQISRLVKAIKEYTYMDKGPVQEVDLHKGLENTLTMLGHKMGAVQVRREYDPHLPHIQGRGGELNQVWTNLIDNAVDAMNGKGTLHLITRCENHYAMVEVTDTGQGIPAEMQTRIFEPFFTTKDVGKGTGLGLDISYHIVQEHKGTMEVQSQPGKTRFIVRLPIQSQNEKQDE